MASTCSFVAGSSSSSLSLTKKYDVFISFRGEDTRTGFTSHLHKALLQKDIDTYIDYRIQKGEQVWVELEKAIKESTLFLVIFSENYASSSWCLDELVELMECMKHGGKDVHVIPVFYKVDPSHVRKQQGSYHAAFAKHEKDGKVNEEKIQKWKNALFQASNLSGFHSPAYRTESEMVEDIIKNVLRRLNQKNPNNPNDFKGIFISDENYTSIESLLEIDSKEVRVIGIWGMGGIGKTTLAAAIFHKISSQYEGTCFLENMADELKRNGLKYTCNKLLSQLLGEDLHIDTSKVLPSFITRRLSHKKVLVVLDDVNCVDLLENLVRVDNHCLGVGSRVIVTTRDKHVLISGHVDKIYKVKQMNFDNSLKLFSLNAFGKTNPTKKYEELSKRAVAYTKGIPLALKVLGSFLHSKSEIEWDSALSKLKKIPNAEIQAVLRLSYDGLDDEEKNIFLDIACFLKGKERITVERILNACGFSAYIGIRILLDKALITIIARKDRIDMHDLVQEMGREIVRQESIKDPGRRSRLWNPEQVCDLLINNTGTDAVEGIWLDTTQITYLNLSSEAFRKMPNLRFLSLESLNGDDGSNSVYLQNGLEFLPKNLRYFGWNRYPLKSLPSTFCMEKLVHLSMRNSNVTKPWHGAQKLPNLEKIDFHGCKHLIECPNLSHAPKLKYVYFCLCENLSDIHPSISSLPELIYLEMMKCKSVKSFSNKICSKEMRMLSLVGSGLKELPPSIFLLRYLRSFRFSINYGLAELPKNFSYLIWLSESREHECDPFSILDKVLPSPCFQTVTCLFLVDCQSLHEIPDNISLLSSLQYFSLWSCAIKSLPESIKYLPRLKYLDALKCNMLECIPALPQSIQCFHIWKCESFQSVLSSPIEPSKRPKCTFMLLNCIKLDQHSYYAILQDFIARIELGAEPLSQNGDCASTDNSNLERGCLFPYLVYEVARSGKICYCLPTRSGKFLDWFHCRYAQPLINIELPPNLLGFVFYLVVSQVQSCQIGRNGSFGCRCYSETTWGEMINMTSFFVDENIHLNNDQPAFEFMVDHVFLWYDAQCCKQIMEAIKERKANIDKSTTQNLKLSFEFFAQIEDNMEAVIIKECGFRWLYSSEGGGHKSKRSREIYEAEAIVVQNNVHGSESNEQKETLPPSKKFKQCVSGTSNLEVEETEELRHLLEELLHL